MSKFKSLTVLVAMASFLAVFSSNAMACGKYRGGCKKPPVNVHPIKNSNNNNSTNTNVAGALAGAAAGFVVKDVNVQGGKSVSNATGGKGGNVKIGDIKVNVSPSNEIGDVKSRSNSSVGDVKSRSNSSVGDVKAKINNSGNSSIGDVKAKVGDVKSTIGDVNNNSGNSTVYNNPTISPTNTLSQSQGQDQTQSQNQQQYNDQNQANAQTNTQNMTYNEAERMHYSGGYEVKNVPDVYAPPAMSTSTCLKAYSGGASWMGGALSLGGVVEDKECTRRATAGRMAEMGYRDVGFEIMCENKDVYEASKRTANPCKANPKFEKQPRTVSAGNKSFSDFSAKPEVSTSTSLLEYDY